MTLRGKRDMTLVMLMFGVVAIIAAKLATVYIQYKVDTWEIVVTKVFLWSLLLFLTYKLIAYTIDAIKHSEEDKRKSAERKAAETI